MASIPIRASLALVLLFGGAAGLWVAASKCKNPSMSQPAHPAKRPDFSGISAAAPAQPLHLLFIHHSCGGQLFASPGPDDGENAIYKSHPNGGNLRARLQAAGYVVHEAAYGSRVGEKTDVFDWLPKFRTQMAEILACSHQDEQLCPGLRNHIIVFKSCFPNNAFVGEGVSPGAPAGPELTFWNARATYSALLAEFAQHPEVLFVCVSAPPLANVSVPGWKRLAKQILGRYRDPEESARLARKFNNWLASEDGWLASYRTGNVAVFDYYDILTGGGAANCLVFPTGGGVDSHPSAVGNSQAADAFIPFLNRAARRVRLTL